MGSGSSFPTGRCGFLFPHCDPDGFATSAEIVDYLEAYATHIKAPIRCGVSVTALRQNGSGKGYLAETSAGPVRAKNVVIATGPYQHPVIPDLASHFANYRPLTRRPCSFQCLFSSPSPTPYSCQSRSRHGC
jgi:cation diffusion facilitator CzcD-associated flavoprotein CzcO